MPLTRGLGNFLTFASVDFVIPMLPKDLQEKFLGVRDMNKTDAVYQTNLLKSQESWLFKLGCDFNSLKDL